MKNRTFLFLLFLFFGFEIVAQVNISRIFKNSPQITSRATSFAQDAITLDADLSYINKVYREGNEYISLTVPISEEEEVTLELERFNVLSKNAIIRTSSGDTLKNVDSGLFYRGQIKDRDGFATVSIFNDRIWSIVSVKDVGSINIVKYDDSDYKYIVYNDQKVNTPQSFECHTPDYISIQNEGRVYDRVEMRSDNCVKFYIEADYELYQERGSVQNTKDWITAVFAEVSTLYNNENINIEISEIKVWDTPDSYSNDDPNEALDKFKDNNPNFNGNLASLYSLGGNNIGGLAWTDILCNKNYSYAYMNIFADYQSVPTYSWTVQVIAHEVGHNMGSQHTHACVWNNNNTQIDDCANQYYLEIGETPEGEACFDSNNPIMPESGTIMSYCHLIDGVGVDLALGFGRQPGDLIRDRYNNAGCLTACSEDNLNIIKANFKSDSQQVCLGSEISFHDISTRNPTKWSWTFQGGTPATSDLPNPVITYNSPGVYDVSLIVSNAENSDTLVKHNLITVSDVPIADFVYTITGNTVIFQNKSTGADSYRWDFGNNGVSDEENPVHEYSGGGDYTVTLTVTNECGSSTKSIDVIISPEPFAKFSVEENTGCTPFEVRFYNLSNTNNILWQFPGGVPNTSTEISPLITYNSAGSYDVTIYATNDLGTDTFKIEKAVVVSSPPKGDFTYQVNVNRVDFTQTTSDVVGFEWDFGDGGSSNQENPSHIYSEDGIYKVKFTYYNICDTVTIIKDVVVANPPAARFSYDVISGCAPLTVHFTNTSSSNSETFNWVFEGGIPAVSTEENPTVVFENKGDFNVSLTVSNNIGNDVASKLIKVYGAPVPNFTKTSEGLHYTFTYTGEPANSVTWYFGDGSSLAGEFVEHTYTNEGEYLLTIVAENECGKDTLTYSINIALDPTAGFSSQIKSGCAPLEVQFNNLSSSSSSWIWFFEGGIPDVSIEENPLVSYTIGGEYDVKLIAIGDNQRDTIVIEDYIVVEDGPQVDFSYDIDESTVEFHNLSSNDANNFYWDFGDGNVVNEKNPTHTYKYEGTFKVKLIASNDCGEKSIVKEIEITITKLLEQNLVEAKLYPNPNNGNFTVDFNSNNGGKFKTRIFNTNGQLLYDNTVDINIWDNKLNFDVQTFNSGIYILELSNGELNYKILFNID